MDDTMWKIADVAGAIVLVALWFCGLIAAAVIGSSIGIPLGYGVVSMLNSWGY